MSDNSPIEWLNKPGYKPATWNPTVGCKRVSPGCENCYPIPLARIREKNPNPKVAAAFAGVVTRTGDRLDWTGQVNLLPDRLDTPLHWRLPRMVFVNSLSDLFHDAIPDEFIAKVFAVMAQTPRHLYVILTKRHARMRSLLSSAAFIELVQQEIDALCDDPDDQYIPADGWPLPNVILGVSVENQKWADIRIPALLETPAAVWCVSAEPLLGLIDLSRWLWRENGCGCTPASGERGLPSGRNGGTHDRLGGPSLESSRQAWEPVEGRLTPDSMHATSGGERHGDISASAGDVRRSSGARAGAQAGVASLPRSDSGRAHHQPQEWRQDGQQAVEPGVSHVRGTEHTCPEGAPAGEAGSVRSAEPTREADHGASSADLLSPSGRGTTACPRCGVRSQRANDLEDSAGRPTITWVICGGESGLGARPMYPEWPRSLRDQCTAAGVPFFFKQFGEWAPYGEGEPTPAGVHGSVALVSPDGRTHSPRLGALAPAESVSMARYGKHRAGAVLDGQTWTEYPHA